MKTKAMNMMGGGVTCHHGMCSRCHAGKLLLLGVIVLANVYWSFLTWWALVGVLLVIGGLLKLAMPSCPHCK